MLQRRVAKELQMMEESPPPGIFVWPKESHIDAFEACIEGPGGTPYERGSFFLDITLPERYPLEPPKILFTTPIYHPNIDDHGRICLDTLTQGAKGSWGPHLNICVALKSIQLLMSDPNPADPLMADISKEYLENRPLFLDNARKRTLQHAMTRHAAPTGSGKSVATELLSAGADTQHPQGTENTVAQLPLATVSRKSSSNTPLVPTASSAASSAAVLPASTSNPSKKTERKQSTAAEEEEEEFFASSSKRRK